MQPGAADACFENPVAEDLLWRGRKVAGAGQRRTRHGLLHQGSLQLPVDAHPDAGEVAQALAHRTGRFTPQDEVFGSAQRLLRERYGTEGWNRMR
jgi:lipoate-protein ligase A